jgi:hypothetical protein
MGTKGAEVIETVKPVVETVKLTVVDCVTDHWNTVVESLLTARQSWNDMQKLLLTISRDEIQLAPIGLQKTLTRSRRADFETMLERFMIHYKGYGGLEAMKVKKGGAKQWEK